MQHLIDQTKELPAWFIVYLVILAFVALMALAIIKPQWASRAEFEQITTGMETR